MIDEIYPTVLSFLVKHASLILISCLIVYLSTRHWFDPNRKNLPPGPWGIPILGYIPFIPADYGAKLAELRHRYGRIFSMRLGCEDVVILSDFDVIKRITKLDAFNYRPEEFLTIMMDSFMGNWNGEEWKEQRKFALRTMHHLGVGKQEIEESLLIEIEDVTRRIENNGSKSMEVHHILGSSITNMITLLLTGQRFEHDHPTRVLIDSCFLARGSDFRPNIFGIVFYIPYIQRLAKYLPLPSVRIFRKRSEEMVMFLVNRFRDLKETFDPERGEVTCFIEAYLREMSQNKTGKHFDESHLIGSAFTFFSAGANTTGDYLTWFCLFMMVHPVVQRKMREEIDDVIGTKRVSLMYRDAMPYTEAVMLELHRLANTTPSGIEHAVPEGVDLEGYFLPKGTHFYIYSYGVHMDPEYFHQPEEFIPERFISDEGKFIRDEKVMPFGFGKRSCAGEPIANTQIFLYVTSLLQKFEIQMPQGKKYGTRGVMDFVGRVPADHPIEAVFKRRLAPL